VEKTADKLSGLDGSPITYDAPAALLGRKVTVYYKDTGSGLTRTSKIYGIKDAASGKLTTLDRLTVKDGLLHIAGVKTETPASGLTFYSSLHKTQVTLPQKWLSILSTSSSLTKQLCISNISLSAGTCRIMRSVGEP
jgi:hypothetical protein